MVTHARLGQILLRLYPLGRPGESWEVEFYDGIGHLLRWNLAQDAPTQEDVNAEGLRIQAEEDAQRQVDQQKASDVAADHAEADSFRQLDSNWSALNLAQANQILRRLIRYSARLEARIRELEAR